MTAQLNPYQAPQSHDEPIDASPTSRIPLILVVIGACSYHLFILLLLTWPGDRPIGALFFLNSPVMVIWIIGLLGRQQSHYKPGIVTAGVQLAIYVIAGGRFGGDDWSLINYFLVAAMLILSAICYIFQNRAAEEHTASDSRNN